MSTTSQVVIIGMGEVGSPLFQILSRSYDCLPVDMNPVDPPDSCSVLHICYPFQIPDFLETTAKYIERYRPDLTVINSTVAPGTTDRVSDRSGARVAYSPVRGKHARMEQDLLFYKKFVGANDSEVAAAAEEHFRQAGFKTGRFPNAKAGEAAKLIETTWLGILVGWAQDVERIAAQYNASYDDVDAFIREIGYLPSGVFPGVIGGHCVIPNIAILRTCVRSDFLDAVVSSNEQKLTAAEFAAESVSR